jgi:hypothetical protein
MSKYSSLCDEFYIHANLNTEMELPSGRETLLHFFEQIKKKYPSLQNFYGRERNEYVLEEDKQQKGSHRWISAEKKRICSGHMNPNEVDEAIEQHAFVMDTIPYTLSVSPLDCESLNLMYGFEFAYRGNHNELLAEALGMTPAMEKMVDIEGAKLVAFDPSIQIALEDDCRTQCRISVEPRTTAYHVRTGEYPEEQLSVYLTMRRYGSLNSDETYEAKLRDLHHRAIRILDEYVVESIVEPLRAIIAIK